MKLKPFKRIPSLIAFGVVLSICLVRLLQFDFIERLERMTYDMRVRQALNFQPTVATNLGFVFINEASVSYVRTNRSIGLHFGLYWPRQVYGRLVQELADQGARAVGLDVIFPDLRDDHPQVNMADGNGMESDDFFALQLKRASNVVIAVTKEASPPLLFATNALALGDISTDPDTDGILRQAHAFRVYTNWHQAFRQVEADQDFGVDLSKARVESRQVVLARAGGGTNDIKFPLDQDGNFDLADFGGENLPPGVSRKAKPFTEERIWHMGIVLAAQELKLDLANPWIDLPHGRITLHGGGGVERAIPVDGRGRFYVDWCLPPNDPHLTQEAFQDLLAQSVARLHGQTEGVTNRWRGKLVVVGSSALAGHELTDLGPTPLDKHTLLVSKHWNVANSIITGRFVERAPLAVDLALIALLGSLAAFFTLEFRVLLGTGLVVLLTLAYIGVATVLYVQTRYWIPLFLPLMGALLVEHMALVTWRVVFEQAEQRRVRSIFSKVVSPKIVKVLLDAENLALGGARREITVLFADVRGFTAFTDASQERVAEYVRAHNLSGAAAEERYDEQARETLDTVNIYLGLIADVIKKHDGTLDKFIGDCVMAFWGALKDSPTPAPRHAVVCVRAAIEV